MIFEIALNFLTRSRSNVEERPIGFPFFGITAYAKLADGGEPGAELLSDSQRIFAVQETK